MSTYSFPACVHTKFDCLLLQMTPEGARVGAGVCRAPTTSPVPVRTKSLVLRGGGVGGGDLTGLSDLDGVNKMSMFSSLNLNLQTTTSSPLTPYASPHDRDYKNGHGHAHYLEHHCGLNKDKKADVDSPLWVLFDSLVAGETKVQTPGSNGLGYPAGKASWLSPPRASQSAAAAAVSPARAVTGTTKQPVVVVASPGTREGRGVATGPLVVSVVATLRSGTGHYEEKKAVLGVRKERELFLRYIRCSWRVKVWVEARALSMFVLVLLLVLLPVLGLCHTRPWHGTMKHLLYTRGRV